MKILIITQDQAKFGPLEKCLKEKFLDLSLMYSDSEKNIMELINSDGPFAFFMMDMLFEGDKSQLPNDMMDLAEERPIIICGTDEELESINKSLIIKNESNTVLRDLNDEEKIYTAISSALKWSQKNHFDEEATLEAESDENFIAIKVRNLYLYESFPYNLYVKIGEAKYVMALEANTPINHSQVAKLIQRKIKFLHIEKDKHLKFLENSMEKATKFFEANREFNKKAILAHLRSAALIQDYLLNVGITIKITQFIDILLEHMIETLDTMFNFDLISEHFNFKFESVISKAVTTSYTSFYLIKELGWKSTTVRKKFLLAGIIQDTFIESDELAKLKSLSDPKIIDFTEEEIRAFPEHPGQIAELARQMTQFPDIDFLLEQHHELPTRDGFPNRPPPSEMQMAVCVFNLASNFARDIDGLEFCKENYQKWMKKNKKEFNVGNFKEPLTALAKCLKLEE